MDKQDHRSGPLPKRLGKGMIVAAWVLLLGLLTVFFDGVLMDQYNPNRRVESVSDAAGEKIVVLKRNRQGHYLATGRINGVAVTFLVDTGATDVVVGEALAQRLGLAREGPSLSRTANGDVASWRTHLDRVALGGIELRNIRASILPGLEGEEVLLGMSYLKRLELAQRGDSLTLRQRSE